MTNYTAESLADNFLQSALAAQLSLREQYDMPGTYQDQKKIAGLHQTINYALKAGEVSALITIGQWLEILVDAYTVVDHETGRRLAS